MLSVTKTSLGTFCICYLLIFISCSDTKNAESTTIATQVKSATTASPQPAAKQETTATPPEDGAAIATINAPDYVVVVHKAIAFIPKDDGAGLMKIKQGHRYVVLDLSVRNTSKNKEVDMGQILLSSKVRDEKGKAYNLNAMAIAAYTLNNPDPHQQAQYNQMWSKIKPGDFYRTIAYGLEVPESAKNFVISLKEDGDIFKDTKRHEATFSVE